MRQWPARKPVLLGFFGLFVLVGGFGTWATQTQIAGAVIASGNIEVDQNRQVVQHPTGGVVVEISVTEGDTVTAGQTLVKLDVTQLETQLSIVESQLFELMARRGRLEAERDDRSEITFDSELVSAADAQTDIAELMTGQKNLFDARARTLDQTLQQLEQRSDQTQNQIVGVEAQEASLARQLELIAQELDVQRGLLERGLAQASSVLALERELASLNGRIGELAASKAEAAQRITEIEIEMLRMQSQRREEAITSLRDLRARELELIEQRQGLITEIDRMDVRSPVSGVVYNSRIQTLRSVVQPAEPMLFVVPQDRPLVIAAQVDPIHIDQIVVGQPVNLRFSALDQRRTPELIGEVVLVSADSFEDEARGSSFYRAEIVLKQGEIQRLDDDQVLIPGMPVEAFIVTDDRSPLNYLVKPMADYFNRAFRES